MTKAFLSMCFLLCVIHPCSSFCEEADRLKIGLITSKSGAMSTTGNAVLNGVLMADSELDVTNRVDFIVEDDQFLPRNTVSAMTKLVELDHVNGIIVMGTAGALAVSDYAERSRIPMIAISVSPKIVAGKTYVLKHWLSPRTLAEQIFDHCKKKGYTSIALVVQQHEALISVRDEFMNVNSIPIAGQVEFVPGADSFDTEALRLRNAKPDAVFLLTFSPITAPITKKLRRLGFKGDFFGGTWLEDDAEVQAAQGSLDGAWFLSGNPNYDGFLERYKAKYGTEPQNGAANGYDVAKMIITGASASSLNDYLHNIKNFDGACGHYDITANRDFGLRGIIKVITSDGFREPN